MTLRTPPPPVLASARVVAYLVEGKGVAICRGCVEDFYQGFSEPDDPSHAA